MLVESTGEGKIVNALEAAVSAVTSLLADGNYDAIEAMTRGRRLSAEELSVVVERYGRTVVPLPRAALDALDVVEIDGADPSACSVVVDLWTAEEGRSDLSLELRLVRTMPDLYEVEVMDLRVL